MIFDALSILFLGILPAFLLFYLARFDRFSGQLSPLKVVGWTILIGFSLKSAFLSYAISNDLSFRTSYYTRESLQIGQILVLTAVFSFVVGFALYNTTRFTFGTGRIRIAPTSLYLLYWPVFIVSVGAISTLFFIKDFHNQIASLSFVATKFVVSETTGERSTYGFLLLGADIILVYFVYALANRKHGKHFAIFALAIFFIALNYFFSSQRFGVLIIIIAGLMALNRSIFDIRYIDNIRKILILVLVLCILSTSSFIRGERREVEISEISFFKGIESTLTHAFDGVYAIDPEKATAIIVRHQDYLLGESFLMFLVAPIPRVLWPEKPNVRIGPYVAQEILDFRNRSGAPPSGIGEFYINFGWLGVLVGMFMLGCAAAMTKSLYLSAPDPDIGRARYVLAMLVLVFFLIGDFSYATLFAIKYGFAAVICEAYWKHQRSRRLRRHNLNTVGNATT